MARINEMIICKILGHELCTKEQLTPDFYVSSCALCKKDFLQFKWYSVGLIEWSESMRASFIGVNE